MSSYTLGVITKEDPGHVTIRDIKVLTETELVDFESSQTEMQKFAVDERTMLMVLQNYQEFRVLIDGIIQQWKIEKRMDPLILENIYMEINRSMINILATFSSYLNLTERKLKDQENGEEIAKRFKEACSRAYDNHFSYRFLYQLRNYSQHYELPVGNIRPSQHLDSNGEQQYSLGVMFHRDSLLQTDYDWKKLRPEIENLDQNFDVLPLLEELVNCIFEIDNIVTEGRLVAIQSSYMYFEGLLSDIADVEGTPCIYLVEGDDATPSIKIMHIPFHVIEIIRLLVKENPNP